VVEHLLVDQDIRCLAADHHTVYAGTQTKGVLRSTDGGRNWQPAGLPNHTIKSLAISPLEPGVVYAGTRPPALFVSRDGGANWMELEALRRTRRWWWFSPADPPTITPYVQAIALSPTDPNVLLVGIELGAVLRSQDGGKSWSGHRPGALRDCHSMQFHATNGHWVYEAGGTGGGAAFSQDGGQQWEQPKEGLERHYGWACAADPERPSVWYASLGPQARFGPPPAHIDGKANAYIFRSMDGAPWQKLGGGLPQPLQYMAYALVAHPAQPSHLYAGLSHGEVWHSADYGDSWQQLPFNLKAIHRTLIYLPG
jgi:hypothetical protein